MMVAQLSDNLEAEQEAHGDRQGEVEQRRSGHAAAGDFHAVFEHLLAHEGTRHDIGEGDDDIDQGDPDENQKEQIGAARHVHANHLGNAPGPVTHGGHEGRDVVDAADKDAADENPDERGQPAKHDARENRSHDGARRRDGGEMLAHEELWLDGLVVHIVAHGDGRHFGRVVEAEQPRQQIAVDAIGHGEDDGGENNDEKEVHGRSTRFRHRSAILYTFTCRERKIDETIVEPCPGPN